jgi:hypothetical protein
MMTPVAGRAFVVPASTGNSGAGIDGNVNNFRANSRAESSTLLVAVSAADGAPVDGAAKRITARLPNWLRVVMYYAANSAAAPSMSSAAISRVLVSIHTGRGRSRPTQRVRTGNCAQPRTLEVCARRALS